MNKRGDGEKILSIWMFIIFGMIVLAVFITISMFYGQEADIRESQANVLSFRLQECFSLAEDLESIFDIQSNCNIGELGEDFYFNVSVYENGVFVKDFYSGNNDFEIQCRLEGRNFAKCSSSNVVKDGFEIKIYSGSNFMGGKL